MGVRLGTARAVMILPKKEIQLAHIRSRRRQDGSTAHTVVWRQGGSREGATQTQTFDTVDRGREASSDVEGLRQRPELEAYAG